MCGLLNNWPSRWRCRGCDAYGPRGPPPGDHRGGGNRGGGAGSGGGGAGNRGGGGGGSTGIHGTPAPTLAARQLQRQQQDLRDQQRAAAAERRRVQTLQEENARLQRELAARPMAGGVPGRDEPGGDDEECDDMDTDEKYATWTEDERQKQIEINKAGLPYLESRFGPDSDEVEAAKEDIEALQRASRESKPFRTHRGQLERRLSRLEAQQERDGEEEDRLREQIESAQERLEKVRSTMDERKKTIDKVDAELKELLRRALAEDAEQSSGTTNVGSPPPAAPRAEAWSAVEATLAGLASCANTPPEQAQQLASFLALYRQVATNVLASPGGAALAAPPVYAAQRWGKTPKAAAAAAAASASPPPKAGGAAPATPQVGLPQPPTPQTQQLPPTPAAAGGKGTTGSGGGLLGQIPVALGPFQQVPARREAGGKGAPEGASSDAGRRQRSSSCTRERRRADAAKATGRPAEDGPIGHASGEGHTGERGQVGGAAAAAAGDGGEEVHNVGPAGAQKDGAVGEQGTGEQLCSEYESSISDVDFGSGSELGNDVDIDMRADETEADRTSRIAKFFKERMQARVKKAKKERRRSAGGRDGVRKPQKTA